MNLGIALPIHQPPVMFEKLTYSEQQWIYRGLLSLAKHGGAFSDQGSAKYAFGAKDVFDEGMCGTHPETDILFKMMHELTMSLHEANDDRSSEIGDWIYSWGDYCRLIYTGRRD